MGAHSLNLLGLKVAYMALAQVLLDRTWPHGLTTL